ncbi:related to cytochrome P450 CYP3/CYP5/CYP6/CYP9 subfamilies [Phialocephala subalpina]|uniref:Related to cytochrome P450 CYP3/CYP5/CYP6/CYP9 subfamilies n=1 Tax=Phialocephala subalpina TaxID=576137 RepID=A0A1L7WI08_9HELO|nr:related to cytochrome P450 CYP3/CYP5/CYP6/CYP9 subfamilies [Phialocephala subalpina]
MDLLSEAPSSKILWTIISCAIAYCWLKIVYDLHFHPLSKFPGLKLAAIGSFLEFYYDVIKDGTYLWEIEKMHQKYGPIIRINSRELHIRDSSFYSSIYAGIGRRVNKDPHQVRGLQVDKSTIATADHDLHRLRRGILAPHFAKRSIVAIEPMINERIDRLCERLAGASESKEIVDLDSAYAALTTDVVDQYFYGENFDCLGNKNFKFEIRDAILGLIRCYNLTRFFPSFVAAFKSLPIPIVRLIHSGAADLLVSDETMKAKLLQYQALQSKNEIVSPGNPGLCIIQSLLAPEVPAQEKTIDQLMDETKTIIFGGTESTARALSVTTFHLLNNKSLLKKLREELRTLGPVQDYTIVQLEALSYLTGVVNEGIRLTHGPCNRLLRCAQEPLQYKEFTIPPGTPVSQVQYFVHMDPAIFPNPHTFDPERWIKAANEALLKEVDNVLLLKIYLTLAKVVQRFDIELFETTEKDVDVYHIRLTNFPKDSNGEIKVKINNRQL